MKDFCTWIQLLFKDYATYKLFKLSDCGVSRYGVNSQGIDMSNNRYIYQGSDQGGKLSSLIVIDVIDKSIIAEFNLTDLLPNCHMNNINVGYRLHYNDRFPLLYVSECKNKHRCFVLYIDDACKNIKLIQTIEFKSKDHYGASKNAFDWFFCGPYIYTFGMTGVDGEMEICKFPTPLISDNESVTYKDEDIYRSFKIQNCWIYQGTKVVNDKLYALFGWDTKEYPAILKIVNLDEEVVEKNINIKGLGELEGLGKYEDGIVVSNNSNDPQYTFIKIKGV